MANGDNAAPVTIRGLLNAIIIIASLFGAWFAIEAKVESHVSASEQRLERRLDRIESQVDDLHKLMIRSKQ